MARINWIPDQEYYQMKAQDNDLEEVIKKEISSYESQGFEFICSVKVPFVPPKVKTPSGKILSSSDIEKILGDLEFGNKDQIEAIKAAEYFKLKTFYLFLV